MAAGESDVIAAKAATWEEVVPPGEAAEFGAFGTSVNRYQNGFARSGDGEAHRTFHVKTHAAVSAEFTISPDIPEFAKRGVFAQARTIPALVRISNGFSAARTDWFPDLLGFSVKLTGIGGPKLLAGEEDAQTQDFVALNQPFLPAQDAKQLMIISLSARNLFAAPFQIVGGLGLAHGLQVIWWTLGFSLKRLGIRSVATQDFYSDVPITLGPCAVKFKWQSRQGPSAQPPVALWNRNYLREDFRRRLLAGDLVFDFLVQFYVDSKKTPIEGAYAWQPADSPYVKLAELRIPQRDLDLTAARIEEKYIDGLSFNPWHAVADHRPIGNIQRARGTVYHASAIYRGRAADP